MNSQLITQSISSFHSRIRTACDLPGVCRAVAPLAFLAAFDLALGCSCTSPALSGLFLHLSVFSSPLSTSCSQSLDSGHVCTVLLLCLSAFPEEQHPNLAVPLPSGVAEDLGDVWQEILLIGLLRIITSLSAQDNNHGQPVIQQDLQIVCFSRLLSASWCLSCVCALYSCPSKTTLLFTSLLYL